MVLASRGQIPDDRLQEQISELCRLSSVVLTVSDEKTFPFHHHGERRCAPGRRGSTCGAQPVAATPARYRAQDPGVLARSLTAHTGLSPRENARREEGVRNLG